MLKTEIVRQIGMPTVPVEENWILRLKMERTGYLWISNLDIICPHLKSDVDIWKHAVWWGMMGGNVHIKNIIREIGYHTTKGLTKYSLTQNLFGISLQLFLLYGLIRRAFS